MLVEEIKNKCPWELMKNGINEETIFYHLCKNNPPTEEDFKPHAYSNIPQRKGNYKKILKNFKKSKNSLKIQINSIPKFSLFCKEQIKKKRSSEKGHNNSYWYFA
ncbi:hypothetical protein JCM12298_07120 [Desulfothermus naphthae]